MSLQSMLQDTASNFFRRKPLYDKAIYTQVAIVSQVFKLGQKRSNEIF